MFQLAHAEPEADKLRQAGEAGELLAREQQVAVEHHADRAEHRAGRIAAQRQRQHHAHLAVVQADGQFRIARLFRRVQQYQLAFADGQQRREHVAQRRLQQAVAPLQQTGQVQVVARLLRDQLQVAALLHVQQRGVAHAGEAAQRQADLGRHGGDVVHAAQRALQAALDGQQVAQFLFLVQQLLLGRRHRVDRGRQRLLDRLHQLVVEDGADAVLQLAAGHQLGDPGRVAVRAQHQHRGAVAAADQRAGAGQLVEVVKAVQIQDQQVDLVTAQGNGGCVDIVDQQ